MKSVVDEFDVFDERAHKVVDMARVLASNAELTDLLAVLQQERDQLDLLLDVTNAVVTQLDTRELFRAVAPALRRCCSADVAALSLFDAEAGALRHHVCDAPDAWCEVSDIPIPTESSLEGSAAGYVFRTAQPRVFSQADLDEFPESAFIRARGIRSACVVPLATAHGILGTLNLGAFADDAFSPGQFPLLTRVAGQIAIAVRNACSRTSGSRSSMRSCRGRSCTSRTRSAANTTSRRSSAAARPQPRAARRSRPWRRPTRRCSSPARPARARSSSPAPSTTSARAGTATFVKVNCAAIPTGPARERAVRPRAGRVHRRHRPADRPLRARQRRHRCSSTRSATSRWSCSPSCCACSRSASSSASAARRTCAVDVRVVAATNRDLAATRRRAAVPAGPLLPAQRLPHPRAAAARAARGHPAAGPPLRAAVRAADEARTSSTIASRDDGRADRATSGPATSASSRTSSSARSSSPAGRRSASRSRRSTAAASRAPPPGLPAAPGRRSRRPTAATSSPRSSAAGGCWPAPTAPRRGSASSDRRCSSACASSASSGPSTATEAGAAAAARRFGSDT